MTINAQTITLDFPVECNNCGATIPAGEPSIFLLGGIFFCSKHCLEAWMMEDRS